MRARVRRAPPGRARKTGGCALAAVSGGEGEAELRLVAGNLDGLDPAVAFGLFRVSNFEKVIVDLSDGKHPLILSPEAVAGLRTAGRDSKLLGGEGKAALFVIGGGNTVHFTGEGWSKTGHSDGFDVYVNDLTRDVVHVQKELPVTGVAD